jgi:tetratricopeptide (TPR) repeat protein
VNKTDASTIEKYQDALRRDPHSKLFAPLAEAYRERGMMVEAEELARIGIQRHPEYVGGYIALGRTLCDQKRFDEATKILEKAVQLSPDNLLAYQLLGECYLNINRPKEALKAYKMSLFLNPMSARSRQAVEKLESLTADEYETDVFQMQNLKAPQSQTPNSAGKATHKSASEMNQTLNRQLSLLDALIVRQDMKQARQLIESLRLDFPTNSEVAHRWNILVQDEPFESAEMLRPQLSREKAILTQKINKLTGLLKAFRAKSALFPR